MATLAAGAAHELATPLGTIALAAKELELHLRQVTGAGVHDDVRLIRGQVDRCRAILDRMAADAGQSAGEEPMTVTVADLLRQAGEGLPSQARVELELGAEERATVCVPRRAMEQALKGLVKNAQEASPLEAAVIGFGPLSRHQRVGLPLPLRAL